MLVHFALLGHHGEERLRIRLLAAGEQGFGVLPAPPRNLSRDVPSSSVASLHLSQPSADVLLRQ